MSVTERFKEQAGRVWKIAKETYLDPFKLFRPLTYFIALSFAALAWESGKLFAKLITKTIKRLLP